MVPSLQQVRNVFDQLGLSLSAIQNTDGSLTQLGRALCAYFKYRAWILWFWVKLQLMDKDEAEQLFKRLRHKLKPTCPLPMNKQKYDKNNYAFLTCIVNMILEKELAGMPCDFDPRQLTMITHNNMPLRTLSRRVDGAFPSVINPIAIWEIKEYYYTTTFGSRISDGVYETLLDGMELQELEVMHGKKINHLLIVDDYFTWWVKGRSYLCRIIDMLHYIWDLLMKCFSEKKYV